MHAGAGLARTAVRATKVRQVPMAPRFNSMAWMLHKRMDELHEKVLTEAVGPHVVYEKRSVVPYEHGGFRLIHSQGRFIPFKLSIVATQTWETVIDALHEQCHLFDTVETSCDVVQSAMWSRAELESGVMETQGGVVMRRVYEEDGSVLFLMATMLLPCGGIGSGDTRQRNLVDRLSLEESSWCRVRRHVDAHTSGVLVHIEGSYSQEVKPLDMNVERGRLEALRDFMHELIDQDMPKNRQRLENRLLDATLAMERCKRMRTM